MPQRFIPSHGGYENLLSFQKSRIVYDGTVHFCRRFFAKHDRTVGQMVQAARFRETEHSRGQPCLRHFQANRNQAHERGSSQSGGTTRRLPRFHARARHRQWSKNHPHARRLSLLSRTPNASYDTFRKGIEHPDPAIAANVMIGLIKLRTFCSTGNCANWRKPSSKRAACASA